MPSPFCRMAFFCVFVFLFSFAFGYRPEMVQSAQMTVSETAVWKISGTVSSGDWLKILFPKIESSGQVTILEEYLLIGEKKIYPVPVKEKGIDYSLFEIKNLSKYPLPATMTLFFSARFANSSSFGVKKDYDLSVPITEFPEFTKASPDIETDDPELRAKAAEEFRSNSFLETISQITEWLNANIKFNLACAKKHFTAKQTFDSKIGVCKDYANLAIAFARIKGIPARYVSGVVYLNKSGDWHTWAEVFLPGTGWIPFDPTWSETAYVDAGHLAFFKAVDYQSIPPIIPYTSSNNFTVDFGAGGSLGQVSQANAINFQNLSKITVEKQAQVYAGQEFEMKAVITNISGTEGIFPLSIVVNEDFSVQDAERQVHLKPDETKTIVWELTASEKIDQSQSRDYPVFFYSIDQKITDSLKVIPGKPPATGSSTCSSITKCISRIYAAFIEGIFANP